MCKIRHSMAEGSQLFSFKTINWNVVFCQKFYFQSQRNVPATSSYPRFERKRTWWVANTRKSWQIETPFFRFVKRAAWWSLNRMWRHFSLDDPYTKNSGVFCPASGLECTKLIKVGITWYLTLLPSVFSMLLVFGSSDTYILYASQNGFSE